MQAQNLSLQRVLVHQQMPALNGPLPSLDWINNITLFRVEIKGPLDATAAAILTGPLQRLRWLSDEVIDLGLVKFPFLGVDRAELIIALCSMMHGSLNKQKPRSFVSTAATLAILESDSDFMRAAANIADLFLEKFDMSVGKSGDGDRFQAHRTAYMHQLWQSESTATLYSSEAILVLTSMLDAVNAVARTNFHRSDRYALSFIVDPQLLMQGHDHSKEVPFCVYYCYGRDFSAFHCRFSNIARGGMRVVSPANPSAHAKESARHFDEVYNLAYAQQLKNKDIPAGGAKAVILVRIGDADGFATPSLRVHAATAAETKFNTIRRSVRAFSDSMLDLAIGASVADMVDFWRGEEQLFFGPDEQVVAGDVEWITKRAWDRGYQTPATIMTSKAAAGINHKEFGVTSEGVLVYLELAVRQLLGIDPAVESFSVKITGGPDGDVAGNLMKFLIRDYPNTAKIVGVADGFGVAEDPEGLSHDELMRLVTADLPISNFDSSQLSAQGIVMDTSTSDGAQRRNQMIFTVHSDVFVPGGGRPGTINSHNWKRFLSSEGVPTSRLVVEGANLFITGEARRLLFSQGIAIIKDSSANKGGVIASSFEVQALTVLSTDDFITKKPEIIADVLHKIRTAARLEAQLLLREYRQGSKSLPELSEDISRTINHMKMLIEDHLRCLRDDDPVLQDACTMVQTDSLLPCVAEVVDLNWAALPNSRSLAASALASHFVYNEGIRAAEKIPDSSKFESVNTYFKTSLELQQFTKFLANLSISSMSEEEKGLVVNALATEGTRAAMERGVTNPIDSIKSFRKNV